MTKTIHINRIRGSIDFAILSIREDEYESVLKRFAPHFPVIGGKQIYEYHRLRRPDGRRVSVAMVRAFDQGQSVAQSVARDTIEDLHPHWLVLCGIAGGVPGREFSLGDVLIANSLLDLSVTAAIQDQPPQFRPSGGPLHPKVERLLGNLPAWRDRFGPWNLETALGMAKPRVVVPDELHSDCYYGTDRVRESVCSSLRFHFRHGDQVRPPLYRIGAGATSNVLLKDATLLEEWQKVARHLTHVEMEAGGVYQAARHGANQEIPLFCVRGISDIVGFKRAHEWTQFACNSSASFLHSAVSRLSIEFFRDLTWMERAGAVLDIFPIWISWLSRLSVGIGSDWLKYLFRLTVFGTNKVDASLTKTLSLEQIVKAFDRTSAPLLERVVDSEKRIRRPELEELSQSISLPEVRVVCLLGSPGSGKTALLALLAQKTIASDGVTLGFKTDQIPKDESFSSWCQSETGLDIAPISAVKAISSRDKVVIILDQLDALASTVDLTSERLNSVLEFIKQCSSLQNVTVIYSCREFDYHHDARFEDLGPQLVQLTLPSWDAVTEQLSKHRVTGFESWPKQFQELLTTPQHLRIYLDRFEATGKTEPVDSYHLMLDDLWELRIQSDEERDLIYRLAESLIESESLWVPIVEFEADSKTIQSLESKGILRKENRRVGFEHQTLLEHAKARYFTKSDRSLCTYVLDDDRQDAILVRPMVWAVLRYLRDAHPDKYRTELESLFSADLRLHMRYLLFEFLGEVTEPLEFEIALLGDRLLEEENVTRILICIQGNEKWFAAFKATHFPIIMEKPVDQQWSMIGVIVSAWDFARQACLDSIEKHWLKDPDLDPLTQRAIREIGTWDERAVAIASKIIRRADISDHRMFWAEDIVYSISENQPQLAPRVFVEAVSRIASSDNHQRTRGPLESSSDWYNLPAVAEVAPIEFLREGWGWFVQTCEEHHSGPDSSVVNYYGGYCLSLDDEDGRPETPILDAFGVALAEVAQQSPADFLEITEPTWVSENAVVHRMLSRGLTVIAEGSEEIVLRYLEGDQRRLVLGSVASSRHSDSATLIEALVPKLSQLQRERLEQLIMSWTMYRPGTELEEAQREWDREARLALLDAIPPDCRSQEITEFVESEKNALPNWNRERIPMRSGTVHHVPPITKEQMLSTTDEEIINAIQNAPQPDLTSRQWTEVEGGWEEPGGSAAADREIAALSKEDPTRAMKLILSIVAHGLEEAIPQSLHSLADARVDDSEVVEFVRQLDALGPKSEEVLSNAGYMLYRRSRDLSGLPDDICDVLEKWLSREWKDEPAFSETSGSDSSENALSSLQSIIWSRLGGFVHTDNAYWPLLALTNGYLMRKQPDTSKWLTAIDKLLDLNVAQRTWAAYCTELRWIRLKGCNQDHGRQVIANLFTRFPSLRVEREGIMLVAYVSYLLTPKYLREFLDALRQSDLFTSRQAYGELLTLIAFRDKEHPWASEMLTGDLASLDMPTEEAIAVGMAFAAAELWDDASMRPEASKVLCSLMPEATEPVIHAIGTVFWASQDFTPSEPTESLLRAITQTPRMVAGFRVWELVEHLVALLPHKRDLILSVCNAIVENHDKDSDLFQSGPDLVKIAMTLQRFPDTRSGGLSLLENLLQMGLDDAFRILRDIDVRPSSRPERATPRRRRRRKR